MLRGIGHKDKAGWLTSGVRCVISLRSKREKTTIRGLENHILHTQVVVSCSPSTSNATAKTWMIGPSNSPSTITHLNGVKILDVQYNIERQNYSVITEDGNHTLVTQEVVQDEMYRRSLFR